jgi:serine/threonine protein phosphatase 1
MGMAKTAENTASMSQGKPMESSRITYAIGDVHGRADLLEKMLDQIQTDVDQRAVEYRIIFLGDIIDRGPDSRRAMDLVHATLHASPDSRLILGNHEEFFLRVLDCNQESERVRDHWLDKGGFETLASYGLLDYNDVTHLGKEFNKRFPHHVAMMRQAENLIIDGNFAFVHAGVRPNVSLKEQREKDLRWIRDEFLNHTVAHEKIVVHGHTVTASRRLEVYANRITLDTGAYATGILSALAIIPSGIPTQKNYFVASL